MCVKYFFIFIISSQLFAFKLSPITLQLSLTGPERTGLFEVKNSKEKSLLLKASIYKRDQNEFGDDILNSTNDIVVFPKQFIVKPNSNAKIRVLVKLKNEKIDFEKAYRLIVEEVPAVSEDKDKNKAGIKLQFLVKYVASLYISPMQQSHAVVISSIVPIKGGIQFFVNNKSNVHKLLKNTDLIFKNKMKKKVITPKEKNWIGKNVLANSKIKINILDKAFDSFVPTDAKIIFN